MAVTVEELDGAGVTGKTQFVLTSEKFQTTYRLEPTDDGYIFYHFKIDKGQLPVSLKGYYSNATSALNHFKEWESKQPKSKTTKRLENRQAMKASKNAKLSAQSD